MDVVELKTIGFIAIVVVGAYLYWKASKLIP